MPVKVEGLREAIKGLEAAGVEVEDLKEVFGPISTQAAEIMKRYVPVASGNLRATVRPSRQKSKATVKDGSAKGRTKFYARPVNYGQPRRGIPAADFVKKTDNAFESTAAKMLEDGLDRILQRVGMPL